MNMITFIVENNVGFGGEANGYVAIPPQHPLHGCHYYELENENGHFAIHNGITYSSLASDTQSVTAYAENDVIVPDNYWVFGFHTQSRYDNEGWAVERVMQECEKLKIQLETYEHKPS